MATYICSVCGYTYEEESGDAICDIAPGTRFEDVPDDYVCPMCGAPKAMFTEA